jgi:hypothetical protein
MRLSEPSEDVPPYLLGEGAGDDDLVDGFQLLVAKEAGLIGLESVVVALATGIA